MVEAGQVSTNYPFLSVRIRIGDWQHETFALMDTGFEGSLVVPFSVLDLGLRSPDSSSNWMLADGSIVETPVYIGIGEIVGLVPIFDVVISVLGTDYILERRVIDRYSVTLDHGENIVVQP